MDAIDRQDSAKPDAGAWPPKCEEETHELIAGGACVGDRLGRSVDTDGAADDEFGVSVGIADELALTGAHQNDAPFSDMGAACVFPLDQPGFSTCWSN